MIKVKQSWSKPTGPHPEGRPVFTVDNVRVSLAAAKKLADEGKITFTDESQAWFDLNYRETATVTLSLDESKEVLQLKKLKADLEGMISENEYYSEEAQENIQHSQIEYHARYSLLTEKLTRKVHKELGIE